MHIYIYIYIYMSSSQYLDAYQRVIDFGNIALVTLRGLIVFGNIVYFTLHGGSIALSR